MVKIAFYGQVWFMVLTTIVVLTSRAVAEFTPDKTNPPVVTQGTGTR
jgi:hypothetical protein